MKKDKNDFLTRPVEHIDISRFDATPIIEGMSRMSFTSRDTAAAAHLYHKMLNDSGCTIILCIAGSTSGGGCMRIYADMIKYNLIDVVVATGATVVDMDFFEALGFRHYQGSPFVDDAKLREASVDRIYDTYIDEKQLQTCDTTIADIADALERRPYSSREFISEMGRHLTANARKDDSLVQLAYENDVPVFCPAFSDSSAGFGLVKHQCDHPDRHLSIDSVKDFRELTEIKIRSKDTGLFMIGGGVPKNFAQDAVVCAELLGRKVPMHKYAVQITVADVRDGACSSSTLKEANSWGKVDSRHEQMVYAEATSILPLIASTVYHRNKSLHRAKQQWNRIFA